MNSNTDIQTVMVKPDSKFIYAGHILKVLEINPSYSDKLGRQFKLCLKGTDFESDFGYDYTIINESDLIIEQPQRKDDKSNTVPLWRRLNEERTKGEWETDPTSVNAVSIWNGNERENGFCIGSFYAEEKKRVGVINAQYTALCVNNFANIVELLEGIVKVYESEPLIQTNTFRAHYKAAKEALKYIS